MCVGFRSVQCLFSDVDLSQMVLNGTDYLYNLYTLFNQQRHLVLLFVHWRF